MTTKPTVIDGTVPVIPTTFRKDESIDCEAISACVRFAADCGVTAVCLPAYGSEFYKLSVFRCSKRRSVPGIGCW